jgi:transglutaminase-like putative cysteine protease
VEYEDLPVGQYTFEVVAVDRDLVYSELPATLSLEVVYQPVSSSVRIASVEFEDIFASFYKIYGQQSIGTVLVASTDPNPVQATVSLYIPDLMSRPFEQQFSLEPLAELPVALNAVLSPDILQLEGEVAVEAEVTLSFKVGEETISVEKTHDLTINGRGALSWDSVARAAAFIAPTSAAVTAFARPLLVAFENEIGYFGRPASNLIQAMTLFEALKEHGVRYVPDANTPYAKVAGDAFAIDHVQSAAEVLKRRAGDCDDLTALFCSLLEGAGISTALVDYPGHIFPLFDSGVARWESYKLPVDSRLYLIRDDRLWIPLEITLIDGSFHEAWRHGADELAKLSGLDQRRLIVDTETAWETFPPTALSTEATVEPPAQAAVAEEIAAQHNLLKAMIDEHIRKTYLDPCSSIPMTANCAPGCFEYTWHWNNTTPPSARVSIFSSTSAATKPQPTTTWESLTI